MKKHLMMSIFVVCLLVCTIGRAQETISFKDFDRMIIFLESMESSGELNPETIQTYFAKYNITNIKNITLAENGDFTIESLTLNGLHMENFRYHYLMEDEIVGFSEGEYFNISLTIYEDFEITKATSKIYADAANYYKSRYSTISYSEDNAIIFCTEEEFDEGIDRQSVKINYTKEEGRFPQMSIEYAFYVKFY